MDKAEYVFYKLAQEGALNITTGDKNIVTHKTRDPINKDLFKKNWDIYNPPTSSYTDRKIPANMKNEIINMSNKVDSAYNDVASKIDSFNKKNISADKQKELLANNIKELHELNQNYSQMLNKIK